MDRTSDETLFVADYSPTASDPQYSSFETRSSPSPPAMDLNYGGGAWPATNMTKLHKENEPRPGWFVSRGNGLFVPLIALDELPESMQLRNVPRFMLAQQTVGMEFLGEFAASGYTYEMVSNEQDGHIDQASPYGEDASTGRRHEQADSLITGIASLITGSGSQHGDAASIKPHSTLRGAARSSSRPPHREDEVQVR